MAKAGSFRLPSHYFGEKGWLHGYEVERIFKNRFPDKYIRATCDWVKPNDVLFLFQLGDHIVIDLDCSEYNDGNIPIYPN